MHVKNGTLETFLGKEFYFKEINKKQKLNSNIVDMLACVQGNKMWVQVCRILSY